MLGFNYGTVPEIYEQLKRYFATRAQGLRADSSLQPTDINTAVQGFDADLLTLANLNTKGQVHKALGGTYYLVDTRVHVEKNSTQWIYGDQAGLTYTTISFEQAISGLPTDGWNFVNNAFTAPANGIYLIGLYVYWFQTTFVTPTSAFQRAILDIHLNDVLHTRLNSYAMPNGATDIAGELAGTALIYMAAGQQMKAKCFSPHDINLASGKLSIVRVY